MVVYGESYSRVKPRVYTVTFVTIDFFSLCIQAVGGALTSVARTDGARQVGVDILIAGLTLQAASLFFFLCLCAEFAWRVRRGDAKMRNPRFEGFRETRRFKLFLYGTPTSTFQFTSSSAATKPTTLIQSNSTVQQSPQQQFQYSSAACTASSSSRRVSAAQSPTKKFLF